MSITVLYPRFDPHAVEERYASWQTQLRLRGAREVTGFVVYGERQTAADAVASVRTPYALVATDPLVVASTTIGVRLRDLLAGTDATAVVPLSNEARQPRQQRPAPAPYLTLRELEEVFAAVENVRPSAGDRIVWDDSDPGVYLCGTELLRTTVEPLRTALRGREVMIDGAAYVHRWSALRGQSRDDLLPFVPTDARSLLDVGCGEGALGAQVKRRQRCRVVGVELDSAAATVARTRLDEVRCADARHVVERLGERFDCVVMGDVIEHVDDPWTLLGELRRVTTPGGTLVASIPNVANASIVGDLLQGRFDYVYMGLLCAGHLRLFTRSSIEEMLAIAGWTVERIVPQREPVSASADELLRKLRAAGVETVGDELRAPGYYVVARNPSA